MDRVDGPFVHAASPDFSFSRGSAYASIASLRAWTFSPRDGAVSVDVEADHVIEDRAARDRAAPLHSYL